LRKASWLTATLWLFDVDLNQATARKTISSAGSTPAALTAAAPDLEKHADLPWRDAPDKDGLQCGRDAEIERWAS
jgi:hypothetical protein